MGLANSEQGTIICPAVAGKVNVRMNGCGKTGANKGTPVVGNAAEFEWWGLSHRCEVLCYPNDKKG